MPKPLKHSDKFVWQPGDLVVVKPAPDTPRPAQPQEPRKQGEKP